VAQVQGAGGTHAGQDAGSHGMVSERAPQGGRRGRFAAAERGL
jgi:hypothetical protein